MSRRHPLMWLGFWLTCDSCHMSNVTAVTFDWRSTLGVRLPKLGGWPHVKPKLPKLGSACQSLYVYRENSRFGCHSSFGTHPLWIRAKLGMERWCKVFYLPTGEIRDSDAIRVSFEFQDSSFMDSCRIKNGTLIRDASYAYRGNSGFWCHSSMFRVSGLILYGFAPN